MKITKMKQEMIEGLEIKLLFDRFNYSIGLNNSRLTILTGPNGYGKSTILKIVNALSTGDLVFFDQLLFQKICFVFTGNKELLLSKRKERSGRTYLLVNNKPLPPNIKQWFKRKFVRRFFDSEGNVSYRYFRPELHFDEELDEDYFYFRRHIFDGNLDKIAKPIKEFLEASDSCGSVSYISEQRLVLSDKRSDNNGSGIVDAITSLPSKMREKIDFLTNEYSNKANSLDSTYPQRLLSTKHGLAGEKQFSEKMVEANDKFKKLSQYDLASINLIGDTHYSQEFSKALKVYFDDFQKKYEVFEPFINKLDRFTSIINRRLAFKQLRVNREKGLFIVSLDDGRTIIQLQDLSSGEKQEILLFYNLIFESESCNFLLIDEPEISLHVLWQRYFVDDLEKVIQEDNINVIIATHSPQIINNRWDYTIDLRELYEKEHHS